MYECNKLRILAGTNRSEAASNMAHALNFDVNKASVLEYFTEQVCKEDKYLNKKKDEDPLVCLPTRFKSVPVYVTKLKSHINNEGF